jgi:hypothetical protein
MVSGAPFPLSPPTMLLYLYGAGRSDTVRFCPVGVLGNHAERSPQTSGMPGIGGWGRAAASPLIEQARCQIGSII